MAAFKGILGQGGGASSESERGGVGQAVQIWYLEPLDPAAPTEALTEIGRDHCAALRVSASALQAALQAARQGGAAGGAIAAFEASHHLSCLSAPYARPPSTALSR
jgi:hypothetical protein